MLYSIGPTTFHENPDLLCGVPEAVFEYVLSFVEPCTIRALFQTCKATRDAVLRCIKGLSYSAQQSSTHAQLAIAGTRGAPLSMALYGIHTVNAVVGVASLQPWTAVSYLWLNSDDNKTIHDGRLAQGSLALLPLAFPNLTHLSLEGITGVTPSHIAALAACSSLTHITLPDVGYGGLSAVAGMDGPSSPLVSHAGRTKTTIPNTCQPPDPATPSSPSHASAPHFNLHPTHTSFAEDRQAMSECLGLLGHLPHLSSLHLHLPNPGDSPSSFSLSSLSCLASQLTLLHVGGDSGSWSQLTADDTAGGVVCVKREASQAPSSVRPLSTGEVASGSHSQSPRLGSGFESESSQGSDAMLSPLMQQPSQPWHAGQRCAHVQQHRTQRDTGSGSTHTQYDARSTSTSTSGSSRGSSSSSSSRGSSRGSSSTSSSRGSSVGEVGAVAHGGGGQAQDGAAGAGTGLVSLLRSLALDLSDDLQGPRTAPAPTPGAGAGTDADTGARGLGQQGFPSSHQHHPPHHRLPGSARNGLDPWAAAGLPLCALTSLQSLTLEGLAEEVGVAHCAPLAQACTSLTWLDMGSTVVDGRGLACLLSGLSSLTSLSLYGVTVPMPNNEGMPLTAPPSLSHLSLGLQAERCELDVRVAARLPLTGLSQPLDLHGLTLIIGPSLDGGEAAAELAAAAHNLATSCHVLSLVDKSLSLVFKGAGRDRAMAGYLILSELAPLVPHVRFLSITGPGLGHEGMCIGGEELHVMGAMWEPDAGLRQLSVGGCHMDRSFWRVVCEALHSLKVLEVGGGCSGAVGAFDLALFCMYMPAHMELRADRLARQQEAMASMALATLEALESLTLP